MSYDNLSSDYARAFRDCLLLESLVTTRNEDGTTNLAPMGILVDWPVTRLLLRPFKDSKTYDNLLRERRGIMYVTDDVLLIARAAIDRIPPLPAMTAAPEGYGERLVDCARWYCFDIEQIHDSHDRAEIVAHVGHQGCEGQLFGFNRAKHAVIEAAILTTRLQILPIDQILDDFSRLATIVDKTAGPQERLALTELQQYLTDRLGDAETKTLLDP